MSLSENSAERLHYFKEWTKQTRRFGRAFSEILTIISTESKMNGFKSAADYVMNPYEWPTFKEDTEVFWNKLLPLYQRMHAVVRERLTRKYGSKLVIPAGPIDVHLLDIQGYLTSTVAGLTDPFKTSPWKGVQISLNLKRKDFTEIDAFKEAEAFYVSLGLPQLPVVFWTKSSIQAPALMKGDSACQASAWDFCDGQDYRSILKLGSSKPFSHVMKMISDGRQETVDASATLEYFLPTLEWLEGSSERRFGWDEQ
ncbi:hypothetical protein MRX96_037070 [Rhipicephalus microplus]